MRVYSFEKLAAWKKARILTLDIYNITKGFPSEEKFGLISQMRRCSISVSSNLAEGSSRTSFKDQAHFTQLSYSSLLELLNQLILALDLEFINENQYKDLRNKIEELSAILNALRKSQLKNHKL